MFGIDHVAILRKGLRERERAGNGRKSIDDDDEDDIAARLGGWLSRTIRKMSVSRFVGQLMSLQGLPLPGQTLPCFGRT
jgi:hypothetical protein